MLKTRVWKTAHEMIDTLTRENGGVPLTNVISDQPLTKEYWDKMQKKLRAKFEAHALVKKIGKLTNLTFL